MVMSRHMSKTLVNMSETFANTGLVSFFGGSLMCSPANGGRGRGAVYVLIRTHMHRYSDDVDAWYPHNTQAYDDAAWRNSVFGFENKTAVAIAYIGIVEVNWYGIGHRPYLGP